MKNIFLSGVAVAMLFVSCKKEEITPEPTSPTGTTTGTVSLKLEHTWANDSTAFKLNSYFVHPMNQDSMSFTTYKYYLSNVRLKKADGTFYAVPNSYYLVDLAKPESATIQLSAVPNADYVGVEYLIGVDSTRNVSGAQSGALATTNGMFWSWNSGYIMVKAEGESPQSTSGSFAFHLGGFSGVNKAIGVNYHAFNGPTLKVEGDDNGIHLLVNTAMTWCNTGSCAAGSTIHMPGEKAGKMASDFRAGFKLEHIHN